MNRERNQEIRVILKEKHVCYWEVADVLEIHPSTLTAWLRHELSDNKRERVLAAIDAIIARRQG